MTKGQTTSDRIVDTAARLFMRQGYHGTGLNQLIAESGAPKGSLYFHFPGGKEAVAAAAVQRAGKVFATQIDSILCKHPSPVSALTALCDLLAQWMEKSSFQEGCPITNACLELAPSNEGVTHAAHQIFVDWEEAWTKHLEQAGFNPNLVPYISTTIVTALEGAFILARAAKSNKPFARVKTGLTILLEKADQS